MRNSQLLEVTLSNMNTPCISEPELIFPRSSHGYKQTSLPLLEKFD